MSKKKEVNINQGHIDEEIRFKNFRLMKFEQSKAMMKQEAFDIGKKEEEIADTLVRMEQPDEAIVNYISAISLYQEADTLDNAAHCMKKLLKIAPNIENGINVLSKILAVKKS